MNKRLDTMGLNLSKIAIGCEQLGNTDWGNYDLLNCKKGIKKAFLSGINVFDTADIYGLGKSEKDLSKILGNDRKKVFIISKFGIRWKGDGKNIRAKTFKDSSPSYVKYAIENSLRRLKLDTIPLYFVHWPDDNTNIIDTLNELEKARTAGKILNYGLSNFSFKKISEVIDLFPIAAIQTSFNLISNISEKKDLFNLAMNKGLSIFTYGPLAQGFLTGKYNRFSKFSNNDRRHRLDHFTKKSFEYYNPYLEALKKVANKYKKTIAQVALRWCIDSNFATSSIVGIKNTVQFYDNFDVLSWSLNKEDHNYLSKALSL